MSDFKLENFVYSAHQLSEKSQRLLFAIKKALSEELLMFFYPKNLFTKVEGNEEEVIILSKNNKIWRASCIDNSYTCKFEVWDVNEIVKLELYPNSENESVELKIIFRDNNQLVLNSEMDGNYHWAYKYRKHIRDLFEILST
ncbi:hypothetical protein [Paenibacillus graminis]|uniref:hypothetical protein n=1 Tax=Paenibacillus graminis TaxID=189425 RepID=UPI002DBEEC1F|nr:hypothetical protein [Paenibacillus graminis]MEC0169895.1 DUF3908 family protein [Paenibacillus graminis]